MNLSFQNAITVSKTLNITKIILSWLEAQNDKSIQELTNHNMLSEFKEMQIKSKEMKNLEISYLKG